MTTSNVAPMACVPVEPEWLAKALADTDLIGPAAHFRPEEEVIQTRVLRALAKHNAAVQIAAPDHIADAGKMIAAPDEGDMARALEWVRSEAPISDFGNSIVSAIEEAIAAYDPERMAKCGNTVAAPGDVEREQTLLVLIDRYWDLAYAEGKEGRNHDTANGDAQECRHRIDMAIAALRSQGQAVAVEDAFNAGWRMAADWAERDDLLADMDSGAYTEGRAAALAQQANKEQP